MKVRHSIYLIKIKSYKIFKIVSLITEDNDTKITIDLKSVNEFNGVINQLVAYAGLFYGERVITMIN